MAELARSFAEVQIDFGTGDGLFAYRTARKNPKTLVIGVDANAVPLREVSHRASRRAVRGGAPNALFCRLSLEQAPADLDGLADVVTVLFPWGSLLRAVAVPEPSALRRLEALGKSGARVHFLFGYGADREERAVEELELPDLGDSKALRTLETAYAAAGLEIEARHAGREQIASVQSTWAKKMAFSASHRTFVEIHGRGST